MKSSKLLGWFASATGLLPNQILAIASTAPLRYKTYQVPKRTGGFRKLAQPAREVKNLQYVLGNFLRPGLPIHEAVTAYEDGCSIVKNASMHAKGSYLLKLDFQNFFPSILEGDFIHHLKKYHPSDFTEDDFELIVRILFWSPDRGRPLQLCIGAPTSPLVSNSILFDFDSAISSVTDALGVSYTRYADDLSFSSGKKNVLRDVLHYVKQIVGGLDYPSLMINTKKTVHASRATQRVVTGIVIKPDGGLSVGRDRKRMIRSMWHRKTQGKLSDDDAMKLEGLINFVESVEPGFRSRLRRQKDKAG